MTAYRAAALADTAGTGSPFWYGKWHRTWKQAEAQALRWRFETPRPPADVWIEELVDGDPVIVAVLHVFDDKDDAA